MSVATRDPAVVVEEQEQDEHPLLSAINDTKEDDVEVVRAFFLQDPPPTEVRNASGMSPLMAAAWKGKVNTAKFLIEQGCDVNGGGHEHAYTALHFAALAGQPALCRLLVQHGANVDAVNSVKRNPAQMAAFVGNKDCVSIINNYVPKEDVYYFTRKQPLETEAKLPFKLAKPIHELVMCMNTHPVRIALNLKANPELLENTGKVCQILELMSDREFKNRRDVNEILSLKFHIIHYIVKDISKQMEKDKASSKEKKTPFIDRWIKSMLLGRDSDGYTVFQEDFLRQSVKEFPYQESQLFKVLITNFVQCKKYGESATAADFINQSFNGQRGFKDFENCDTCGDEDAKKKCSSCKSVQYCDAECQKHHWFVHKKFCAKLKENYESQQRLVAEQQAKSEKEKKEKAIANDQTPAET